VQIVRFTKHQSNYFNKVKVTLSTKNVSREALEMRKNKRTLNDFSIKSICHVSRYRFENKSAEIKSQSAKTSLPVLLIKFIDIQQQMRPFIANPQHIMLHTN